MIASLSTLLYSICILLLTANQFFPAPRNRVKCFASRGTCFAPRGTSFILRDKPRALYLCAYREGTAQVLHGAFHIAQAEGGLHFTNGGTILQTVHGVTVTQGHAADGFVYLCGFLGAAKSIFRHAHGEMCSCSIALEDVIVGGAYCTALREDWQELAGKWNASCLVAGLDLQFQCLTVHLGPFE